MKYAVVESGGKQYLTREGEVIEVDRLGLEDGKSISLKNVLLLVEDGDVRVGDPYVKGAQVKGTILGEVKGPKIVVFRYIPKERYRRKQGHRQRYTRIAINSISAGAARKKAEEADEVPKTTRGKTTKAKAEETPKAAAKAKTTKPKAKRPAATKEASEKSKPKSSRAASSTRKKSTARSSKSTASSKKTTSKKPSTASKSKKDEG